MDSLPVPEALRGFFQAHPRLALAFSGGTDSAYLLYAALACGCTVRAYYIRTAFQPAFELEDAQRLAEQLGADLCVLPLDILSDESVRANPPDRCYHCKRRLFGALLSRARADGFSEVIDGTNASDDAGDRPGMRALAQMRILSPLRLCGITKPRVRTYSRTAGLFTWDKPAYACLATRIPCGTPIDAQTLRRVEGAEAALSALGFSDLRVRVFHGAARIQLPAKQMAAAIQRRADIRAALAPWFKDNLMDLEDRG